MGFLCIITLASAIFFAVRFFLLKRAIRGADRDLQEIRKDLQQNQILHLSTPDREVESLMKTVNQTLEDIRTERQEYEKRERAFQSEIENISHDLRTPLTVILGYLKWMKVQQEQTPEMLETIERKAEYMQKLVEDFYDLSRLTAKDYEVEMKTADVGRILREALMDSYQMLEHQKLELNAKIPDHAIEVPGDEAALERIFSNLLQNAGRYAHRFLQVFIVESGERVWICFENDVENMKASDAEQLFERFYRKETARTQGGTGLGLTVAKQLASAMGAELTADLIRESEDKAEESRQKLRFTLAMKKV